MNTAIASALTILAQDYAAQAALTGDTLHRRLIRDAYTQLCGILGDYTAGRCDDDVATAWLDVGRYTLARFRVGRYYLDEALAQIRVARL